MQTFRTAFTLDNFMTASKAVIAGEFTKIGEYKVQAGEIIEVGYGGIASQSDAIGRIYAKFATSASAEVTGKLRMHVYSPQNRPLRIIHEFHTSALNTVETDRTKQTPLPYSDIQIGEDYKLVLEFEPDANATIDPTKSKLIMDMTQSVK